ncbi:hypothetical protein GCM10027290_32850 [Micromonospora sonneratiae]|uniref:PASTA domain-containing protein n=1 Tax=Micromonospora sonneratiae TaxID=1184706 RepID=A0ABW3Y9Q5_9ACTN
MADDRQQPRDDPADGRGGPEPDDALERTGEFDRIADDDAAEADEDTEVTRPVRDGGATPRPTRPVVWTGRAEVPLPGARGVRDGGSTEWDEDVEYDNSRWWMPILVGLVALLLLAVLGFGIWLIVGAGEREPGPGPLPSPTPSPSVTRPSPTTSPSGSPGTTSPVASVPMPPLVGLSESTARAILDQYGMTYRVRSRVAPGWQPGIVIDTDPRAGVLLVPGQEVTLVVTEAPPTATATVTPSPGPTATRTR